MGETMSDEYAARSWMAHYDTELFMDNAYDKWNWKAYQTLHPFFKSAYQ